MPAVDAVRRVLSVVEVASWVWMGRESDEIGSVSPVLIDVGAAPAAAVGGLEDVDAVTVAGAGAADVRLAAAPSFAIESSGGGGSDAAAAAFGGFAALGSAFAFLLGGSAGGGVLRLRSSTIVSVDDMLVP